MQGLTLQLPTCCWLACFPGWQACWAGLRIATAAGVASHPPLACSHPAPTLPPASPAVCLHCPLPPAERVVTNLAQYGNTSAASIPLALDEAVRRGDIKEGEVLAIAGFGAGLSWASAIVRWG